MLVFTEKFLRLHQKTLSAKHFGNTFEIQAKPQKLPKFWPSHILYYTVYARVTKSF